MHIRHIPRRFLFIFLFVFLFLTLHISSYGPKRADPETAHLHHVAVVSLTSSLVHLDKELPLTIHSLITQTVPPKEIRLYLPEECKRAARNHSNLPPDLSDPLVKIYFNEDLGPSTKYVPIIEEMLDTGSDGALNTPIIIVDDDHIYSPRLVETLLKEHLKHPDVAVGLRGWRIRADLHWGVPSNEFNRHVLHGHLLSEPYRVGVLTANEGYLVTPRFFMNKIRQPRILDKETLMSTSAHLVDDIWMSGSLATQEIPRYIVSLPGPPSLHITMSHHEANSTTPEITRAQASDETLRYFEEFWVREWLWYRFSKDVAKAKGVVSYGGKEHDWLKEPIYIGMFSRIWKALTEKMNEVNFKKAYKYVQVK